MTNNKVISQNQIEKNIIKESKSNSLKLTLKDNLIKKSNKTKKKHNKNPK